MAIDVVDITPEQKDRILQLEEGHYCDLKAVEIKPSKLSEVIAAFSNTDGGELYIGIDETPNGRVWRGFTDQEDANAHLQLFEQLFPLGQDFQYTFLACQHESGLVLQIQITKTQDIKYASDGKPYIRRGAQKLPVTDTEGIRRLEYAKGVQSFETQLIEAPLDVITNSASTIEFMLSVVPTAEPEAWLRKQQLIRDNKASVAGTLLFSDEPQALLPKRCGVKVYRYKTQEREGFRDALAFDPITVEGCLYKQIQDAVATTTRTVEATKRLGDENLEEITYPPEALHEIITNALLHRDYSIADDVHIRVFDNRVEVESPGRLPAHVTVKNILYERFARNGNLVRLINKFPNPPNKDVGEGLNTAFSAMNNLGLKDPIIEERDSSVLVVIRHERLASPEEIVLQYLETHESIKNAEARQMCHVPTDFRMKNIFNRLVDRGLIEKVPGTRTYNTAYRKREAATTIDSPS